MSLRRCHHHRVRTPPPERFVDIYVKPNPADDAPPQADAELCDTILH
jgi:hypothetical protein